MLRSMSFLLQFIALMLLRASAQNLGRIRLRAAMRYANASAPQKWLLQLGLLELSDIHYKLKIEKWAIFGTKGPKGPFIVQQFRDSIQSTFNLHENLHEKALKKLYRDRQKGVAVC